MENVREHRRIDLVGTRARAEKLGADPLYRAFHIFHANLFAVERYKTKIELNKPIYTGASVLDLSKLHMMNFHYDFIKEQYPGEKSVLHFTDTDSLLYSITTPNIYDDMRKHHDHFDLSNYPDEHSIFRNDDAETVKILKAKNKKIIGKYKDEAGGDIILEFVGLRAKAYAYRQETWNNTNKMWEICENKKLKGIKKCTVKKKILFDHYKDCLYDGKDRYASMVTFRSNLHRISTIEQTKKALSRYDDKRFILNDGIATNAHGHIDNLFEFIGINF